MCGVKKVLYEFRGYLLPIFLTTVWAYKKGYKFILFLQSILLATKKSQYMHSWVVCDRLSNADDNGEHLYRYILKTHPELNAYYVLDVNSKDWSRLEKEGFRLIRCGTKCHREALKYCDFLISSHADDYIVNYFGEHTDWKKKFVFLQHGVTKDNLSSWLNFKKISLLVTTTKEEYKSFVDESSPYVIKENEVQLLGMPRYDRLLELNHPQNVILVAPTWRKYLHEMSSISDIKSSKYIRAWQSFLGSESLKRICQSYNYQLIFYPHQHILNFLPLFKLPSYVQIYTSTGGIQQLIGSASLLVTDYSSLAFEMGFLNKPVVYYQFDRDDVFNLHKHTYSKGYFSYECDGFGEVTYTEQDLLLKINELLKSKCKPERTYLERMRRTFFLRDGKNCERVFNAIKSLD